MKKSYLFITGLLLTITVMAQHQELHEKPGLWKEKENLSDSNSILAAFRKGSFSGHFRFYFMATNNRDGLSDYHANAIGGGIKFESGKFRNFQVGVSGFFVFNIGSSDLSKPDPATASLNRYEVGLFDIQDPSNKKDIDRLEELYLKYHFRKNQIILGKQLLNTPFINLQDGRMRPSEVEGIWTEIRSLKKWKIQGGYLYGMSPRSTVKWFKVDESIGIYPSGVNEQGGKSSYAGQLESKGILLTGLTWDISSSWKIQGWNQWVQNIFNSSLLQPEYEYSFKDKSKLFLSAQLIYQQAIRNGGNNDPAKSYLPAGSRSFSFGARAGWKNENWETSLNYTRITAKGRYLMPREWGRDPFFTFLPRERNEGFGDLHAVVAKAQRMFHKAGISGSLALGHYQLPDVLNYRLNKYGLPSYNQVNIDCRYQLKGVLKGMEAQLLFVFKGKTGNSHGNDRYVINKVDMTLWNFLLNYAF